MVLKAVGNTRAEMQDTFNSQLLVPEFDQLFTCIGSFLSGIFSKPSEKEPLLTDRNMTDVTAGNQGGLSQLISNGYDNACTLFHRLFG